MVFSSAPLAPFILDCDTGRDDALAIWYALLDEMPLCGVVASYGNTPLNNVVENCRRVLGAFPENEIPVFKGADAPTQPHRYFDEVVAPRQATSGNGLCNITLPFDPQRTAYYAQQALNDNINAIIDFIKAQFEKHGTKLTYVITGPATNFALICAAMGARLGDYIDRVVMMGGKFDALWDKLPFADFNIGADPYAVSAALKSGVRVDFVAMNTTWPIMLTYDDVMALAPQTELARHAQDIMVAHCRDFSPEPVFRFHDPAVMVVLKHPEWFQPCCLNIDLAMDGAMFGRLIGCADGRADNAALLALDDVQSDGIKTSLLKTLGFTV